MITKLEKFIDAPISYQGTSYTPVSHRVVVETIKSYLNHTGHEVVKESYVVRSNGQKVVGKLVLSNVDNEMSQMLSWKNSLDGSMSFGVCSGNMVMICENGVVFGDKFQYKRRHTGNAVEDIINSLKMSLSSLEESTLLNIEKREKMKNIHTSHKEMAEQLGKLYVTTDIISSNQASTIRKQIIKSDFDYKSPETLWEFYNHCTYALKESHPLKWHEKHLKLGTYIIENYDI